MDRREALSEVAMEAKIPDPLSATLTVVIFLLTVLGMAFREFFGVNLGR